MQMTVLVTQICVTNFYVSYISKTDVCNLLTITFSLFTLLVTFSKFWDVDKASPLLLQNCATWWNSRRHKFR